jgi:hypothetical protein
VRDNEILPRDALACQIMDITVVHYGRIGAAVETGTPLNVNRGEIWYVDR